MEKTNFKGLKGESIKIFGDVYTLVDDVEWDYPERKFYDSDETETYCIGFAKAYNKTGQLFEIIWDWSTSPHYNPEEGFKAMDEDWLDCDKEVRDLEKTWE